MTKASGLADGYRYSCEEAFARLADYVDRELSPDEIQRVDEHLETCIECAKEYAFEAGVLREIKERVRRIELPTSLRRKVDIILGSLPGWNAPRPPGVLPD
jgi:anti-sigma factor (TIGR02949 family)